MNSPSNPADGSSSGQGQALDQSFEQIDLKAIRNLFKELEVKLDELRGHL